MQAIGRQPQRAPDGVSVPYGRRYPEQAALPAVEPAIAGAALRSVHRRYRLPAGPATRRAGLCGSYIVLGMTSVCRLFDTARSEVSAPVQCPRNHLPATPLASSVRFGAAACTLPNEKRLHAMSKKPESEEASGTPAPPAPVSPPLASPKRGAFPTPRSEIEKATPFVPDAAPRPDDKTPPSDPSQGKVGKKTG